MVDKAEEEKEVWKTYPDYPFIEASNLGRIRTKDRWVTYKDGRKYFYKGKVLKHHLRPDGYMQVQIHVNGKPINLLVHRMVATCFLPNPDNLPEVNHKDSNPKNNAVSNLEWCTRQENISYRDKLGHYVNNNPGHPVIAINPETSEVLWFESQREAARQLDASQGNIGSVIRGEKLQTKGWWFCNADENAVEKTKEKFGDKIASKVEELIRQNQK